MFTEVVYCVILANPATFAKMLCLSPECQPLPLIWVKKMEFKFHFSCLNFLWQFQMDWFFFFLRHFKRIWIFFFLLVVSLRERNHIIRAIVFQTMLITESHVYGNGLPPKINALLYWFILEKKNLNQHEEERSPLEHQFSVLFLLFFFFFFVFFFVCFFA